MPRRLVTSVFSIALLVLVGSWAAADEERRPAADRPHDGPPPELMHRLLNRFDENGDGQLTGPEREAARRALAEMRREGDRPPRGDKGDDRPRRDGEGPRRRPTREEILERFDENNNGRLDPPELTRLREESRRREAEERKQQEGPDREGQIQLTPEQRARIIREFDRNRDGQLTGEERERATRFVRERMREHQKKNGQGGEQAGPSRRGEGPRGGPPKGEGGPRGGGPPKGQGGPPRR